MSLVTMRQLIGKTRPTGRGRREPMPDRVAVMAYLRPQQAQQLHAASVADNVPVTQLIREAVDLLMCERAGRPSVRE